MKALIVDRVTVFKIIIAEVIDDSANVDLSLDKPLPYIKSLEPVGSLVLEQ